MNKLIITAVIILFPSFSFSQKADSIPRKQYTTTKTVQEINLDGIPDEATWDAVQWAGDFIGFRPFEGKEPSHQTNFKILYDEKYLYVGFRMFDSAPDSVEQRMGRRDDFPGDFVEINIDSYHDLRTAFSFTISASGVRGDEFVSNNGNNWDESWNPIWTAKSHIDDKGWTAEIKIPLSQLRFGEQAEDKVWGIQVQRNIFRHQERSTWQRIPPSSGEWVSGFAELHGLEGIKPQKQIEIAPYLVGKMERSEAESGNPFATGKKQNINIGVDGKVAITSDLILDFTINPDFGQVEADPSQVRLDGFQNFFEEQRPFFVESRNIFEYEITGSEAGGNYNSDLLFYSRRIGSSPHGYPDLKDNEYSDSPPNTSILGAAKFSGKTQKGWSVGIMDGLTQREHATIDLNGERREEEIEPLSNYFVSRIQKDFNGGDTQFGGIITAVSRQNNLGGVLHDNAVSGGIDFSHFWNKRIWYIKANLIMSHVSGTAEKIAETQQSIEHLFQRKNAPEVKLDESRTSLNGTGGTVRFGKNSGKEGKNGRILMFDTGITFRSPELELNDMGFMQTANEINHFTWIGLNYPNAFSIFRNARLNYNHFAKWDFSGQYLNQSFNVNGGATFKNNWGFHTGLYYEVFDISNTALRGGSTMRLPNGINSFGSIFSDESKKLSFNASGNSYVSTDKEVKYRSVSLGVNLQPINAFSVNVNAGFTHQSRMQDQYVNSAEFKGETRIIVAGIDQKTLRYTLRLNYNITPDLTIQYYGQPFTTRPEYKDYGLVIDPMNKDYHKRFQRFTTNEITEREGEFHVDENGDGTLDYSFNNPNFNFVQFRSNMVARWEYKAGSEFYLVWSQGNSPDTSEGFDKPLNQNLGNSLFGGDTRNIFLVKWTYRFLK